MASEIKVDNIKDQCGTAVITKCGATHTVTAEVYKANTIKDTSDNTYLAKCGSTVTLGGCGQTITLAAGASQTGFGRTGTVNWDTTAKTTNFTAVSGNGYFINTTSGPITVTLPASPSAGDIVSFADYTNTWQTNNVTVGRNSSPIGGIAQDALLSTEGQSVTFVYVDGTEGWKNIQDSTSNVIGNPNLIATGGTITTCGNYKIHTFTGPGTFCVSQTSPTAPYNNADYLVVAGGGGGGSGGAGAGGYRESSGTATGCYTASPLGSGVSSITLTATAYPITVGGGGTAGTNGSVGTIGGSGSNSVFSTITSTGGGGGGGFAATGGSGGSGGGGGKDGGGAGSGNTPPTSPPQGNNGGVSAGGATYAGGGGGGAGAVGGNGLVGEVAGDGGNGVTSSINATPTARAGGGGGGTNASNPSNNWGDGGTGGGGRAGANCFAAGTPGTANTGGGGGAGAWTNNQCGGTGGSGVVIIRYRYK